MAKSELIAKVRKQGRKIYSTNPGTTSRAALGPLAHLPGRWSNTPNFPGRGWNIIALPFARGRFNYRVLMNMADELLCTAADRQLSRLDEALFLDVFQPSSTPRKARKATTR